MPSQPPPHHVPLSSRPELPPGAPLPPEVTEGQRLGRDGLPRWPAWTPLPALLLALLIGLVGTLALVVIVQLTGRQIDSSQLPPGVVMGGTVVQGLALIGSAVLFARVWAGGARLSDFGIRQTSLWPAVGWTLLTWFGFLAFSAAWAAIFDIAPADVPNVPRRLGADESTVALIGVLILITLVAPVAEEFFFRGFCFTALRRSFGVAVAAVLTGVIFALIHTNVPHLEVLALLGVLGALLCLLYWRTGSILPCMVLHAVNNSIALGNALEWEPVATVATMLGSSGLIVAGALALARRSAATTPAQA